MRDKEDQEFDRLSLIEEESVPSDSDRDELNEAKQKVAADTKAIAVWRACLLLGMFAITTGVAIATHKFLVNEEKAGFEGAFDQYATSIIETSRFQAQSLFQGYKAFADLLVGSAKAANQNFPFTTLENLDVYGENLVSQTSSLGFFVGHWVQGDQVQQWNGHARQTGKSIIGDRQHVPILHILGPERKVVPVSGPGPFMPIWEIYPPPIFALWNFNVQPQLPNLPAVQKLKHAILGVPTETATLAAVFADASNSTKYENEPYSTYIQPLYDGFDPHNANFTGSISGFVRWGNYFLNLLPEGINGIHVVLDANKCGVKYTWEIDGREAVYLGNDDLHERAYEEYGYSTNFGEYEDPELVEEEAACIFTVYVYPSDKFVDGYRSNLPIVITLLVVFVFLGMIGIFFIYDFFQTTRTDKVLQDAAQSNAVVSSMFPAEFRDKFLEAPSEHLGPRGFQNSTKAKYTSHTQRIKKFLDGVDEQDDTISQKPLADFFPEATIMFADIVGFTSWCSVREPSQVFTLLESVYASFDALAKRRRVFKVETVGDCYVAATGLTDDRRNHVIVMARFAQGCLVRSRQLMSKLEVQLGPDTGDLTIRIGLHTGPVTAGVLRGERARFQLFGDTMNTTSRIESMSKPGMILISSEVAERLKAVGKGHWMSVRDDAVDLKGKGSRQVYWLNAKLDMNLSVVGSEAAYEQALFTEDSGDAMILKRERLIDWHVDVFSRLLRQIKSHRQADEWTHGRRKSHVGESVQPRKNAAFFDESTSTCLDEVKEIIELPELDAKAAKFHEDPDQLTLDEQVKDQLRVFISTIAHMYHTNNFHNFEHASHVTMSVTKLLARIVMPSNLALEDQEDTSSNHDSLADSAHEQAAKRSIAMSLHDHTYGITSDALTQFAVVFSALIHDVDHIGVPNAQLIKENPELASVYNRKSVAEQNSIVLSWDLLMEPQFAVLRHAIYQTEDEMKRFRQLVVQTVLATDIADKELKVLRNERWENAFKENKIVNENPRDTINRKATIVIEHLIQASDVSHTMQHWHVYRKWNEHFFRECYQGYIEGRAATDPSVGWYKGEIGFFDFYIIPLAKKLKDCGVFGVSSDEYLNYAMKNRQEWEERGAEVVAEMLETVRRDLGLTKEHAP